MLMLFYLFNKIYITGYVGVNEAYNVYTFIKGNTKELRKFNISNRKINDILFIFI